MKTLNELLGAEASYADAFETEVSAEQLRTLTPAVYASAAHQKMSARYTFVPTAHVIATLDRAGFCVVQARQSQSRTREPSYAAHALRFRPRRAHLIVDEVIPEILLLNSHDGSTSYHLRVALYRAICANGLIVGDSVFPVWKVSHRGASTGQLLEAALAVAERFSALGDTIQRMQRRPLAPAARVAFASDALRLRYPHETPGVAVAPADLLRPKRASDEGCDLWRTFNVVQEHLLRGGLTRRTAGDRIVKTKGIRAIREDVRLNVGLWDRAMLELA